MDAELSGTIQLFFENSCGAGGVLHLLQDVCFAFGRPCLEFPAPGERNRKKIKEDRLPYININLAPRQSSQEPAKT